MLTVGQKVRVKKKTVPGYKWKTADIKRTYQEEFYTVEEIINNKNKSPFRVVLMIDKEFDEPIYVIMGNYFRKSDLEFVSSQQEFDF